ncbi:MAG: CBS domain-containing protein [Methanosarcinales archaeon]
MNWSYQIGSIHGIPIRLHVSFLVTVIFFIWLFADHTFEIFGIVFGFGEADVPIWLKYLLSSITSILFFLTLLFHELSHSVVAQSYGIKIKSITLLIIGGIAQMEDIPKEPRKEAMISAAGPAFSLGIGILAYAIYITFYQVSEVTWTFGNSFLMSVSIIAYYNILLGIFNLIPAFPMDGGRIFRAMLAMNMPYIDATRIAVAVGKSFAIIMGILGLFTFNLFLLLIAFFLYYGAAGEEEATVISVTLEGILVKDVMSGLPDVIYVPPDWTLDQLVDVMFKTKHMGYPVQQNHTSPVLGVITFSDLRRIPELERDTIRVKDVMTDDVIAIEPDADAFDAFKLIMSNNVGRLIVIDQGKIVGIVSRTDLIRSIQFRGAYG